MERFSPSEAALEGFRLTRERPGDIAAWTGFYFLALVVLAFTMLAVLGPSFRDFLQGGGESDSEALTNILAKSPQLGPILLLAVYFSAVVLAGVFRVVLRPGEKGVAHLRMGADELRLTVVFLVLLAFVIIAVALVDFSVVMVSQLTGPTRIIPILLTFSGLAITLWMAVRLSLAAPVTFARRRIAIGESWRITRGHFWSLFGMIIMAMIFWAIVWILVTIIGYVAVAIAGGAEAMQDLSKLKPATIFALVFTFVIQLLLPVLQIVMVGGPLALAYQQLAEPEAEAADEPAAAPDY